MRAEIRIRNRLIGDIHPLFIMAEVGVTCNYDLGIAKDLIDVTRAAGADAVKFIFWFPDEIMSDRSVVWNYDTTRGPRSENMYELLSRLRFTPEQWQDLKAHADARDVILFSTVNSPSGIELAERIGLEAYKLSSWDYNHVPLWRRIAALGKPMIIDTGPVHGFEIARALQIMRDADNDQAVLVHCFHTDDSSEMNMRSIPFMRTAYNTLVGFSSRDRDPGPDIVAVALGASMIEKRLTMSRTLAGHHHILSLEPKEFEEWVRTIRDVQRSLGIHDVVPSRADLAERKKWFRRLVANRDIPKGTVLTADMLEGKRPANGTSPEHLDLFVGRTVKRDLKYNDPLAWDDV